MKETRIIDQANELSREDNRAPGELDLTQSLLVLLISEIQDQKERVDRLLDGVNMAQGKLAERIRGAAKRNRLALEELRKVHEDGGQNHSS